MRMRAAALVFGAIAVLACGDPPPVAEPIVRPVKTVTIGEDTTANTREFSGKVEASQRADLGFEVAGTIVEFPVDESAQVKQGDLLARLDPRDYQARFDAEQAKVSQQRAEYQRSLKLFEAEVIAKQELERKLRAFEVAKSRLRTAQKALDDTRLLAPFDGVVARKLAEARESVQAKQPVLTFQNASVLEVVLDVPERTMAGARPGLTNEEITERTQPRVVVSAVDGRSFPARFVEYSTTADPVSGTYSVTVAFDRPDDVNILPGMTAKVIVRAARAGSGAERSIPASAVIADTSGETVVWIGDPESMAVSRVTVKLGGLRGGSVTIASGLEDGQIVAVSGVHQLRPGMIVRRIEK